MNEAAWDLLCKRVEAAKGDPAEQMRVLAAINEFVAGNMSELVRIAADALDAEDGSEHDEQA